MLHLLVEKHYVWLPDLVRRQSEDTDPPVVRLVPLQLVVIPDLRQAVSQGQPESNYQRREREGESYERRGEEWGNAINI